MGSRAGLLHRLWVYDDGATVVHLGRCFKESSWTILMA
jgi:hypothetical protein